MTRLSATRRTARRTARTVAVTVVAGTLTLGASACSGDAPAASTLVADSKKASTGAKNVDLDIVGDVNGTKTTMTIDGTLDGTNQKQIQTQGEGRSEGLVINTDAYLKGNAAFWKAIGTPDAAAEKLKDAWWKGTSTGQGTNPTISVKQLLTEFYGSAEGKRLAAKDAKVEETTTEGTDTYTISDPESSDSAKLSVRRDGDHQVVRIENYSSTLTKTKASYTFTKWNDVDPYTAPKDAKPISSVR